MHAIFFSRTKSRSTISVLDLNLLRQKRNMHTCFFQKHNRSTLSGLDLNFLRDKVVNILFSFRKYVFVTKKNQKRKKKKLPEQKRPWKLEEASLRLTFAMDEASKLPPLKNFLKLCGLGLDREERETQTTEWDRERKWPRKQRFFSDLNREIDEREKERGGAPFRGRKRRHKNDLWVDRICFYTQETRVCLTNLIGLRFF